MTEMSEEVVYALRHIKTNTLLIYNERSNDGGDFCNSTKVTLYCDYYKENLNLIWYIDAAWKADYVRNFPTEWYNSGMECPGHEFEPEELEVVRIHRTIMIDRVKTNVPTLEEYFRLMYEKKDPEHYQYLMKEYKKFPHGRWANYSTYNLEELMSEGRWTPKEEIG